MSEEYFPGKGCSCSAWDSSECCCDVDWTDPEVSELRKEVEQLKLELAQAREVIKILQGDYER